MIIKDFNFPSATGVCEIYGYAYLPDDEVKAILVIHHGMAEHQKRYKAFIDFLVSNGYGVYMHDMANHGISNQNIDETGYFGKKDGYKKLVEDFKTVVMRAKSENPDKKIIVMGHSMGSFVCRCFTAWYPDVGFDGAIYMGTGGSNPIAGVGEKLAAVIAKATGYKKKVALLDKISFGSYNSKFEKRTGFDWLTRDTEIVDKYISDDYCGFLFSAQGMNDLVRLLMAANSDEWYEKLRKDLNILVTSGAMDPVCEYSKGIEEIKDKLAQSGHSNVTVKLYPDARHEILNEINRDEVLDDILLWLNTIV